MRRSVFRTRIAAVRAGLEGTVAELQEHRLSVVRTTTLADVDDRTRTLLRFLERCERAIGKLGTDAGALLVAEDARLPAEPHETEVANAS